MKKKWLLAALLTLPLSLKADQVNLGLTFTAAPLGTANQSAAVVYGVDTTLTYTTQTLRQIGVVLDALKVSIQGGSLTVTSSGTFTNGTVTAYQGTSPWVVTGNVSVTASALPANAAEQGTLSALSTNQATSLGIQQAVTSGAAAYYVNANGFNFLSATAFLGVTGNAEAVLSLSHAAGTNVGPVFVDLGCSGATGFNYIISDSSTAIPGFVANAAMWPYQPCGQITQIPLEWNANAHLHAVASGLSSTTASVGIISKKRQ